MQVVPMTREYPFAAVITAVIPSWASEQLSSGGNFDPSVVMRSEFSCFPFFSSLSRVRPHPFAPVHMNI